jgi:transcriptional regulator with XRE-family HTH domain
MSTFPEALKQVRIEKGYSMDALCELYNRTFDGKLNKSTLSRYENGLQEPMLSTIINLAHVLNVSLDELLVSWSSSQFRMAFERKELLGCMEKLNEEGQKQLLDFARYLLTKSEYNA